MKPIALVKDAILDCSKRGDIVLDPFAGSGTTLLSAAETGRVGAGIELDPIYADLTLRRLQTARGEVAIHGESFDSFAEVAAHRQKEDAA